MSISMEDSDSDGEEEKKGGSGANSRRKASGKPQYSIDVASLPTIKMEEVPKHKSREDCWTVVDGLVYDVTHYIPYHPGGKKIMLGAGREASETFRKYNITLAKFVLYFKLPPNV